jgi:DNA-binding protein H-NS
LFFSQCTSSIALRAPAWIANVKDRNKYLIEGDYAVPATVVKKTNEAKAGNNVRGQAPKYRDPKSGATWSGRGPAPAWLAGAKDRTKFLIDRASEGAAEPTTAVAKKAEGAAATKAAALKKRAAKKAAESAKAGATRKALAKKPVVAKPSKKVVVRKASVSADSSIGASRLPT